MYLTFILVLLGLDATLLISLVSLTKSLRERSKQLSEAKFIISDLTIKNKILQEQIDSLNEEK